jgi:hypothetical protein
VTRKSGFGNADEPFADENEPSLVLRIGPTVHYLYVPKCRSVKRTIFKIGVCGTQRLRPKVDHREHTQSMITRRRSDPPPVRFGGGAARQRLTYLWPVSAVSGLDLNQG